MTAFTSHTLAVKIKDEGFFKALGARIAQARKDQGITQQQIEAVEQLPKTKQQFVSQMLDTVLAQQARSSV